MIARLICKLFGHDWRVGYGSAAGWSANPRAFYDWCARCKETREI